MTSIRWRLGCPSAAPPFTFTFFRHLEVAHEAILRRERLVEFDEIDVLHCIPARLSAFQQRASNAHDIGSTPAVANIDEARGGGSQLPGAIGPSTAPRRRRNTDSPSCRHRSVCLERRTKFWRALRSSSPGRGSSSRENSDVDDSLAVPFHVTLDRNRATARRAPSESARRLYSSQRPPI